MLRTITIGSAISVQGTFVQAMPDGKISVQVDNRVYSGVPVLKK